MKQILTVLALATASCLAVPALAQTTTPGSGGGTGGGGSSAPGAYTGGAGNFFTANASGALEVPPNASPGRSLTKLDVGNTSMSVDVAFSNLISQSADAHIHCCTASPFSGAAPIAVPFDGFPTGVTNGNYTNTFALDNPLTYDPGFITANGGTPQSATTALLNAIAANEAYVNIHTTAFPNGEIRGWLVAAPVPEPAEWAMLGLGVGGLLWMGRRRRLEL
jgi:hypothetical protein